MHGKSKILCIAGKNQCAIDCLSFLIKKYKGKIKILALPNKTDDESLTGRNWRLLPKLSDPINNKKTVAIFVKCIIIHIQ